MPVYIGDLVNEADATVDAKYAASLCARLNQAIAGGSEKDRKEHANNCISHIVRLNDLSDTTQAQTVDLENWYVYSSDHFWSLEDLQTNKRLFGSPHASFFFILLNRAIGPTVAVTNVAISRNVLTVKATNSLKQGQTVRFAGIKTANFLNTQTVAVASTSDSVFTAPLVHEDYSAAADSGSVFVVLPPTPVPTPDERDATADCTPPATLPNTGADGAYASYKVDAKRKTSANVEHLFQLLGAAGLKTSPNSDPSASPATLEQQADMKQLLASLSPRQSANANQRAALLSLESGNETVLTYKALLGYSLVTKKCHMPDAEFGGGIIDVAYRPSDISITGSFHKGEGSNEHTETIGKKTPYVVDNEGRYFVDFSVPLTLKKLSEIQYQSTSGAFSPVNVNSTNAFMAIDLFYPAVDVKSPNWTRFPHPLAGVGFAGSRCTNCYWRGLGGPIFPNYTWEQLGLNSQELQQAPTAAKPVLVARPGSRTTLAITFVESFP